MTNAKEKLLPLISEANKQYIDYYLDFLTHMQIPSDLSGQMAQSGEEWGASYNQMFGPMMKKLYVQDENVKKEIHARVGKLGVPKKAIISYFSEHIVAGPLAVNILMDGDIEIPKNKKKQFIKLTGQLMLYHLKKYAGLEKKLH